MGEETNISTMIVSRINYLKDYILNFGKQLSVEIKDTTLKMAKPEIDKEAQEYSKKKLKSFFSSLLVIFLPIIILISLIYCIGILIKGGSDQAASGKKKSMATMSLSLTNIFKILIFLSPFIIVNYILFFSIASNNAIKGIIFLCGVFILLIINYILKRIFSVYQDKYLASKYCNILPKPFTIAGPDGIYTTPSTNVTLITFIITYIFYSMFEKKNKYNMNYPIIIFFLSLLFIISITEVFQGCVSKLSVYVGVLVGLIYGIIFKLMVKQANVKGKDLDDILHLNIDDDICRSKFRKSQKYKCVVKHT